jgi:hypothetical protein
VSWFAPTVTKKGRWAVARQPLKRVKRNSRATNAN